MYLSPWEHLLVLLITRFTAGTQPSNWHVGCYHGTGRYNRTPLDGAIPLPVQCGAICLQEGSQFTAVAQRNSCECLDDLPPENQQATAESCSNLCNSSFGVALRCGGPSRYSIYKSAGPFLLNVSAEILEQTVYIHEPMSIQLIVTYAGPPNTTTGLPVDYSEVTLQEVNVTVDYGAGSTSQQLMTGGNTTLHDDDIFTYNKPGDYIIEVHATNPISSVLTSLHVTVLFPVPAQLQLSLMTSERPSCVPSGATPRGRQKTQAVFARERVSFQASADAGYNLTFDWSFGEVAERALDEPANRRCRNSGCTTSNMNHTYAREGLYTVNVKATYGNTSVSDVLQLVVVRRELRNLTLTLENGQKYVARPSDSVRFLVSMITSDRQKTHLRIDFGDGVTPSYHIVEQHGRYLGLLQGASNQVALQADYGEGCLLRLAIDHIYDKQGYYDVTVHVWNNHSNIEAHLNQSLTVQRRLQGMRVNGRRAGLVGVSYRYIVEFSSMVPIGVNYTWTVLSPDESVISSQNTSSTQLDLVFATRGIFTIKLHAVNLISSDKVQLTVSVREAIEDLSIQLQFPRDSYIISTGDPLTFEASVSAGSGVEFEWNFGDGDDDESVDGLEDDTNVLVFDNQTSIATHTFTQSGTYNIEVRVFNNQDSRSATLAQPIVVQDHVEGLRVTTDAPTLKGKITIVTASLTAGTGVIFTLVYNDTRIEMNGSLTAKWSVSLDVGVTELTVVASNGVSTLEQTTFAEIQRGVDLVTLITKVFPMLGEKVVFIALQNGVVSNRTDLVYSWTVMDQVVAHTRVPVLERVFTESNNDDQEIVDVGVIVSNKVSRQEKTLKFAFLKPDSTPRFIQGGIKEIDRPINFTLIHLPMDSQKLLVYYTHNGIKSDFTVKVGPHHTGNVSWLHNFSMPGIYEIEVTATGTTTPISTVLALEERITNPLLVGPTAVAVFEMSRASIWDVEVDNGSHLLYDWSVNGQKLQITPDRKLRHRFTEPGEYMITVNVSNSLSWERMEQKVIAEFPLRRVRLTVRPVLSGRPTTIRILVVGGPLRSLHVDLGDGSVFTFPQEKLKEDHRNNSEHGPTILYSLKHTYINVSTYDVRVNASNYVTSVGTRKEVRVEEPTTGVRLNASHGPIVALGTTVVVVATVETGKNLTFDWLVSDGIQAEKESNGVNSSVRLEFDRVGVYNVTVYVTNSLDSSSYVMAGLPYLLSVFEPISDLSIYEVNRQDWALLQPTELGTGQASVTFRAIADRGSSVTFHFDFGDGTTRAVPGPNDWSEETMAAVTHVYNRTGIFTIRVRASNPLGNTTAVLTPFYVQIPPRECRLRHKGPYVIPLDDDFVVTVTYSAGTDVMVDWDMGDQTEYKNKSGSITHHYNSPGSFTVVVKCYNKAGFDQEEKSVVVITPISKVQIEVEGGLRHPNKHDIYFNVILFPEGLTGSGGIGYAWEFGQQDRQPSDGTYRMRHRYSYYGRYAVHVTAKNAVSSKRSPPVLIEIIEPLAEVQLYMTGEPLLGNELTFQAYHYKGSNVTYIWNFSDGHLRTGRNLQTIQHTYKQIGEYVVSVVASNPFGNKSASRSVFVLQSPCSTPKVTLLEGSGQREPNVTRGQEVKLETDIKINCSITSAANYTWSIVHAETGIPVNLTNVPGRVFTDPILFIPRYALSYGRYAVTLKVVMTGTIVYAEAQTHFSVVPADLMPVISGGLQRYAQRTEKVIMDGSTSKDPDFPNSQMRHIWYCHQLNKPESSCFKSDVTINMNGPILHIPGSSFTPEYDSFVFNLNLSRISQTRNYTTSQVLEMKSHIIDMTLSCFECEDGLINSDQRLIVEAQHPGHQEDELEYSWKLYSVAGNDASTDPYDPSHCVHADGSSYYPLISGNNTNNNHSTEDATTERSGVNGTLTSTTTSTSGTQTTNGATSSTKSITPTTAQSGLGEVPEFKPPEPAGPEPPDFFAMEQPSSQHGGGTISEGYSGRRHDSSGSSGGRAGPESVDPTPAGAAPAAGNIQPSDPTEGQGSRRGSGSGYPQGQGRDSPSISQNDANRGTLGGSDNDVADTSGGNSERFRAHIVSRTRSQIRIHKSQTTTGTNKRALVFHPKVLLQGREYIIEGHIKHKATGREGTALTYVEVNQSPSQGQCSLSPEKGTEMDTIFTVICSDWKDNHLPIQYEISYSLGGGSTRDLIYQGLNHKTTFMLPAGRPEQNHTVNVSIAILDSFGARTTVCSLPVKVTVQGQRSGTQEEEDLYQMVAKENSTIQTYVSKGDNRNARLHAHLVAHKLNRLHGNGNETETTLRAKLRTSMLQTLRDLPMRDVYEVQQTTSAVAASTAVSAEMERKSLEYASEILAKATEQVTRISDVTKQVDSDLINVAIQGSSNIVAAASQVKVKDNTEPNATKPVVERTRWSIHNLTQIELNHTVLGEEPRSRETEVLLTYAGRFRTSDIGNDKTTTPNFVLPASLTSIIDNQAKVTKPGNSDNQTDDCYEMHVVTYKRNPFLYGKGRLKRIDSQVASLSLYSCEGSQVVVDNLPTHDQVAMTIPNIPPKVDEEVPVIFELHKHQMQVHQLKVSLDPTDLSSLTIIIELLPVPQGRLFPIALLLRPDESPTPAKYQYKKVFPASAEKLNLFLPAHALNESMTYYLGVVDAHFNGARPRPGEIQLRHYTLKMWRGQCVYWDEQTDDWSNRGCTIQDTSTPQQTECRCKHLTAFGSHNSLVPNDLHFSRNVDEFFDLNENPVTFTLVITVLGLYIVLLVLCVMSDNHDEKKGAIVHLVDNSPNHVYTYVITMETGMRHGAGTSAKVSLVLHGKEGMSETRELVSESGQPLFERNSRDTFIMTMPENMGQIWKVQLWHNNAGASPNWYLSRVIVKDINNGQTFYFSCEKWFAVEEEDGKVEREIMALDSGLGFAKVLWAKGTQYLTDYHLWFSMLVRPSYSRFTRAQRLTCCLALLMSYMAVNAAWYRESNPEYRGEFGLIDVSWRAVVVGAITSLIVLPVNFLLVFIFRRSKIKKVCIEDPPEKKYYPLKRDSIISLDSTVRLLQPAVTPSIFDQSMLNWQSLQDWAQRQWTKRYQQELAGHLQERKPEEQISREEEADQASNGVEECLNQERPHPPATDLTNNEQASEVAPPPTNMTTNRNIEDLDEKPGQSIESELRRQHELDKYVLESIRSSKPRRCFLPYACRYIAWVFAFIIIVGCSVITVLYGFRFGKTKSILWIQSLFFSFIQCVFISHPIVVLIISIYTAIRYRNDLSIFDHHDDGVIEQRTNALLKSRQQKQDGEEDLTMGIAARQRARYLHYARPPQEKQLIEARKKIMKEKKATSVLSESVSVIILLVLLFFVAYSKDVSTPYRLNSVLKDLLTKTGPNPLQSVQTVEGWYRWSQTSMLDALYWEKWYNGQHTNHEKGYVANSALLGTISVRQLRVKTDRCHTADTYGIMTVCYHHYAYGNHENKPYGVNGTWRFYESNVTRATGLTGKYAHYDGSGYQIILPNTREYAYEVVKGLETGRWIDRNTRAVIVEFTLYSAPTKLFSSVTLLLEQSPAGGVRTSARVSSVHLFRYTSGFDNLVLACELMLVVVTMYKLHCEVGELAWYKKAYFKNPWKTIEATVLLLLLAYIACYIYRFVIVYEAVELMRATYHEEFVDVSYIAYWDEILRSLLGFIILLVIIQSLRLFRNRKVFAKFGGVYRKAGMELLSLAMMMTIWVCAYTCLGYAVYGSISYNFSGLETSLTTVLGLLTGQNGLTDVDLLNRTGSQLFLVSFLVFVVGSLTAYIVAVLTFHYRIYRDEGLPSLTYPEFFHYFWNKLLQFTCLTSKPDTSESEDDPAMVPAEFRMAAIESQVDEMLFRITALTGGSGLPEKPPMYFTDSDGTYGTYGTYGVGEDGLSSGGSEVRAFDEDRFEHRLHKIEDNLMANEPHLAQLLHLDAIGVPNVLSQERESQLRSALEFEIFRQLQVQRRNSAEVRSLPSDNGHVVIHRLSSLSGSVSSSGGASSDQVSPVTTSTIRRSREPLCRTRTEMDVLSMRSARSVKSRTSRDHVPIHSSSRGSLHSLSRSDVLILQPKDSTNQHDTADAIPLQDLTLPSPSGSPAGEPRVTHSKAETQLSEDPTSTSSCSSGGAEVRYIVGQAPGEVDLGCSATSNVGPPSTANDSNSLMSTKLKIKAGAESGPSGVSIESKPGVGYDFLDTDTSSGSEAEGAQRPPQPQPLKSAVHSLRKTKSRGKGKGQGSQLMPPEGFCVDGELGLDNEGYASEGEMDKKKHDSTTTRVKSHHKT